MNTQLALGLPAAAPSDTVVINARCTLRAQDDQRVIVVGGLPVYHYCAADAVAEAYVMVMLVESGFAQQTEVARAFGKSERTVRRQQERYVQAGMVGLSRPEGWRPGRRRIAGKRLRIIQRLKSEGLSNRAIAQRLGVNEKAIRKLLGPKGEDLEQLPLVRTASLPVSEPTPLSTSSELSAAVIEESSAVTSSQQDPASHSIQLEEHTEDPEPVPMSLDHDASDRSLDRQMAYLGLLDDAVPMFRDGSQVPSVCVLLALPFLMC